MPAAATVCLATACMMPNPAFKLAQETDSGGGSNSETAGTSNSSSGASSDSPTTPTTTNEDTTDGSGGMTSSPTTGATLTTTDAPTTDPVTVTESSVSDTLTDTETGAETTGAPLDPPTCDAFSELPEVAPLAMKFTIDDVPVNSCLDSVEYTGWQYPIVDPDPAYTGFGFHELGCTEGVMNLGPTHKLTGRFPAGLEPEWSNNMQDFNAVECVTVSIEWGPVLEEDCEIRSVTVWRHRNPEIVFELEPTPLWAAVSNFPELDDPHHLEPIAPIEWGPYGECLCVPEEQECCVEPNGDSQLQAGTYKAYVNPEWEAPDMALLEGEDGYGLSTFGNLCSSYQLRVHRARVEPLCDGHRDSLEWVAQRSFIGANGFACN